jgi:hypothetical protein
MEQPLPTVLAPGTAPPPAASDWSRVTSPDTAPATTFGVGYLVSRTFSTWGRNALLFALLGGLGNAPTAIAVYLVYQRMPSYTAASDFASLMDFYRELGAKTVVQVSVAMVCMSLVMAAVCQGAVQALRGEPVRLGAMLAAAVRRMPSVLGLYLLAGLAITGTICTLALPILFMVGWCAAVPAAVVERAGPIRALGRSWKLTRGFRWQVLAGFLVIFACLWAASALVQGVTMAAVLATSGARGFGFGPAMAIPAAIQQVFAGVASTVTAAAHAVAYHGLRTTKEGGDPVVLAKVFE